MSVSAREFLARRDANREANEELRYRAADLELNGDSAQNRRLSDALERYPISMPVGLRDYRIFR
jgi:hypothetical protein